MFSWKLEDFQEIITSYAPTVDDHGPLVGPIQRFSIRRDADLQLCMDTEGPESVGGRETRYPPGTVRINEIVSRSGPTWGWNLRPLESALRIQTRTSKAAHQGSQRRKWIFTGSSASSLRNERHATPLIGWRMSLRYSFGPTTSKGRLEKLVLTTTARRLSSTKVLLIMLFRISGGHLQSAR